MIFVTLIGLSCGLDLPHVAVLATFFGFLLIHVLNARLTYSIRVRALSPENVAAATLAYRTVLEQQGCRIINEKKNPEKGRVCFIFRSARHVSQGQLEKSIETGIDEPLRGFLDWEVD